MAISRDRKQEIITEVQKLFKDSKLTIIANYEGLGVEQFQALRSEARGANVVVKVIKNRLFKLALGKDLNLNEDQDLNGMLVYVFSLDDEVKGAQIVKKCIKQFNHPLEFVGGIDSNHQLMDKASVAKLADLPSKDSLINQLIFTLKSPLNQVQSGLNNPFNQLLNNLKVHKN